MSTLIELPNGDRASLEPYNVSRVREALKSLAKKNIRITSGDSDILNSLEFQIAAGKCVVKDYEVKQDDGTYKSLSDMDRTRLLEDRTKITNWLIKQAQELANNEDKMFDDDSKN